MLNRVLRRALAEAFEAKPVDALPFVVDVAVLARENAAFRRVLYTGPRLQLVAMCLAPGTALGRETHAGVEQVIAVVAGTARAWVAGRVYTLAAGATLVVPPGVSHDVANAGTAALQLVMTYAPPQHPPGTLQHTPADAT